MSYKIKLTIYVFLTLVFLATFLTLGAAQDGKKEETINYAGFEFAPTLSLFKYDDEFIEEAEVINNIVRSRQEAVDRKINLMLTAHFDLLHFISPDKSYTFGPYLLLKFSEDSVIDTNSYGIGLSVGFAKLGKEKFVFGIGRYFDMRNALASNFEIDKPLPSGETRLRVVERRFDAWVLTFSRPF
jgi:hypothetical protein